MPLRLGMLGMWHTHANGIVRRVAENPKEFSLVGGYDPDAGLAAARRKRWQPLVPNLRLFDKPDQLLRQPLDGVVVEGRVHENLRLARLALEAGKPVLLEKPAGTDLDAFRRLHDLAQRRHLRLQMLYLFRYMPAVQEMLQRARKNEFGRVYEFRARLPKDLGEYKRFVQELAPYRGGMFFEMAGHVIDMMLAVLGRPRQVTPFLAHHHTEGPANYLDNGVAGFGFANAWGIVEVPALEVAPHARRVEVYGTAGALTIPHLGSGHLANKNLQPVDVYRAGEAAWRRVELNARPLQLADLREFAACVARKKQPDFSPEHDLTVQEALLRASGMLGARKP
jgi:predicted dehydrogenase